MKEHWKIWIAGYGEFDFDGTEQDAEQMRENKARCEGSRGHKWRTENQTETDRLTSEIVAIWKDGKGVPQGLLSRLAKAKREAA